jgi:hypothetical protein
MTRIAPSRPHFTIGLIAFVIMIGLLAAAMLLPLPAHGLVLAEAAPAAVSHVDWMAIAGAALLLLLKAFSGVIVSGLTWFGVKALPFVFEWIKAHSAIKGHAEAEAIKNRALDVMELLVAAEYQSAVEPLKAQFAAGDVSPEQLKVGLAKSRQSVIDAWHKQITAEGIADDLRTVVGVDPQSVAGHLLEAAVAGLKQVQAVPVAVPVGAAK